LFKKNKVEHINGFGKIISPNKVEVDGRVIETKNIIIATGSEVANPLKIDIDEEVVVSSTGALSLKKIPENMIVIGGGVIGIELGSVYKRLGSNVKVIEYLDRITPTMDKEVSKTFQKILEKQGIEFLLSTKVLGVKREGNMAHLEYESKDGSKKSFTADCVLVCVGRRPFTDNLGLENVGVKLNERGFIEVDKHLRTNVLNIYAIGDVIPGPMLAHKAEDEGVAVSEIIAGRAGHVNYDVIPNVIYTMPEVASVGKTEEELVAAGVEYNVGRFPMLANSRARAVDATDGFVKVLACKKTDRILGCHIISKSAGDIIHEVVAVMEYKGSAEDLARTCHAHPTLNEAIKEACLAAGEGAIHF
jgi:dihydrolipoamide dehydrogenase